MGDAHRIQLIKYTNSTISRQGPLSKRILKHIVDFIQYLDNGALTQGSVLKKSYDKF